MYDHQLDDGVSFACGRKGHTMKRSFMTATSKVRQIMQDRKAKGARSTVFLLNTYGYAMLSLMQPFDGIFSEGRLID